METNKNIYFASDFHLGAPNHKESLVREKLVVEWMDQIKNKAEALFLVGDIFDFWFEYKRAVPQGFVRFLGKVAEFTDAGIKVHFFPGNHDMWIFKYLQSETGMIVHKDTYVTEINEKKFFINHGDGLGPGDTTYKFLKKIFRNKISQWLFGKIHPDIGIWIARKWSHSSRIANGEPREFRGEENEMLAQYAREILEINFFHYFVFGHRHTPIDYQLTNESRYINLGDWIQHFTYAVFDGEDMHLKYFSRG
ncbi:MAG: UDP-2,3-diacylglucosamine diphosphatase [Bacteroidota bacterium]